jgi:N-acetyl-gamma-glutamyl-phosphate reductase
MRVLVLGSTGYAGMMLLRLLGEHPEVSTIVPVSSSAAGEPVAASDPGLSAATVAKMNATSGNYGSPEEVRVEESDVVFSALPHGAAAKMLAPYVGRVPVIDLSADFRIRDASIYESTYKVKHPMPELLSGAVYGLAEWHREELAEADIIAVPGCYPTATLLPLLPFSGKVAEPIVVNAISGISGAGRKETQDLLFNERSENSNAYNPGRSHRHVPEIEQELAASGIRSQVLFTPHLAPLKQGMLATIVCRLTSPVTESEAERIIASAYRDAPCVGLTNRSQPQTRDVRGTNRCDLAVKVHGDYLQLFSAIDNLVKGAAGQAIQCMNIRRRIPETTGLRLDGEF